MNIQVRARTYLYASSFIRWINTVPDVFGIYILSTKSFRVPSPVSQCMVLFLYIWNKKIKQEYRNYCRNLSSQRYKFETKSYEMENSMLAWSWGCANGIRLIFHSGDAFLTMMIVSFWLMSISCVKNGMKYLEVNSQLK